MPKWLLILVMLGLMGFGALRWWSPPAPRAPLVLLDDPPLERAISRSSSPGVERAIERAVSYLDGPEILSEHFIFYVLYFLERRFELGVWQSLPERHAAFMAALGEPQPQKELFRRLIEPEYVATRAQIEAAEDSVDRVTTAALYCRDYPLDDGFDDEVRKLAIRGGYHQSHAAMALQWLEENDCGPNLGTIEAYVVDLMSLAIRTGDRSSDLEIERSAFLSYLGHADRVPDGMARDLVRLQNADGGWSIEAWGASNWHPTFLALWFLLESEGRGNGAPMIIPNSG